MDKTLIILGPTAVGKTEVSILLAEKMGGEIISADAFQAYRGMDVATAAPDPADLARVPHHLVGFLDPSEEYSAARFRRRAVSLIRDIRNRALVPIVVGGSGMYLRALVDGLFESPPSDPSYRATLRKAEEEKGAGYLHRLLSERDPVSARRIHPHNLKRIIRALEVYQATGIPISSWQTQWRGEKNEHRTSNDRAEATTAHCPLPTAYLLIGLRRDRNDLYDRINRRAEAMFEQGLEEETKRLMREGLGKGHTAFQALGYKEVLDYLNGEYSRKEAVRRLAANTRHFAKRQLTWWRKEGRIHWIDISVEETAIDVVNRICGILCPLENC